METSNAVLWLFLIRLAVPVAVMILISLAVKRYIGREEAREKRAGAETPAPAKQQEALPSA